jgi:hypothetical protein
VIVGVVNCVGVWDGVLVGDKVGVDVAMELGVSEGCMVAVSVVTFVEISVICLVDVIPGKTVSGMSLVANKTPDRVPGDVQAAPAMLITIYTKTRSFKFFASLGIKCLECASENVKTITPQPQ